MSESDSEALSRAHEVPWTWNEFEKHTRPYVKFQILQHLLYEAQQGRNGVSINGQRYYALQPGRYFRYVHEEGGYIAEYDTTTGRTVKYTESSIEGTRHLASLSRRAAQLYGVDETRWIAAHDRF